MKLASLHMASYAEVTSDGKLNLMGADFDRFSASIFHSLFHFSMLHRTREILALAFRGNVQKTAGGCTAYRDGTCNPNENHVHAF